MFEKINKRQGFTLAEVLITLGIIGIVAALTLPSLITNYREKQRVTQLKKIYSTLQQAFVRAQESHGEMQYWDLANTYTGKVDEDGNNIYDDSGREKVLAYLAESLNVSKNDSDLIIDYYALDGALLSKDDVCYKNQYLKLNDGTIIAIGWTGTNSTDIVVEFKGCEKRGCRVGVDMFYFLIKPKIGVIPLGLPQKTSFTFEDHCNLSKNGKYNGRACTAWVIYKENMDYLHCNDLSWNGKNKCRK